MRPNFLNVEPDEDEARTAGDGAATESTAT